MATVDFSNAQIAWIDTDTPIGDIGILQLLGNDTHSTFTASATSNISIVDGLVRTRYDIDKTHGYVIFTGTFNTSGTEMIWHNTSQSTADWAYFRISNISFNTGDVFSFKVDVNYTFNE